MLDAQGEAQDADFDDIDSDQEELESGEFVEYIRHETEKALKERKYLIKELKSKERRGSIFIDKVKKVLGVFERE